MIFARVHVKLPDFDPDEEVTLCFDFKDIVKAAQFAADAYQSCNEYIVWIEIKPLIFDGSTDDPTWRQ